MVELTSMEIKRINQEVVEETTLGIYVWEMPDGRWIGDDEGNFLSITSMKNNQSKIKSLAEVVKSYGVEEGQPKFLSGRRKIDDEEFDYQKQRLEWGLTPDPLDIGVYKDSLKNGGLIHGSR
jgi:hypothetical protein